MQAEQPSLHIFLSFAHEDRAFRDALDVHLSVLQRAGLISDWHKQEVLPGSEWQDVVDQRFNQADIILLFVTPNFVASDYCYSVQMNQALAKHDAGLARVIPILFRPTFWYDLDLPFTKLQKLPTSGNKAVSEWKNKDRAYVEIVEGIKRAIEELGGKTSPATPAPASGNWHVPFKRNAFFTGRDELLLSLHKAFTLPRGTGAMDQPASLHREASIVWQTVSGLGGIGKTQIALEYAYRYRDEYHAAFWLTGDSAEDLLNGFVGLAAQLYLPERNEADQDVVIAAVKRTLARMPRWLMVIDNLDSFERLDELIPVTGDGDMLITTRRQATGTLATLNEAEKMTGDEGALFLLRRAKVIGPDAALNGLSATAALSTVSAASTTSAVAVEHARSICQLVDGLPLALDQAGAYIEETKIGLPGYIALYQKHAVALLKQRRKFASGHPASLVTTLSLCIEQVRQQGPACLELMYLCAFLQPDAIPLEFFYTGAPELGQTLQALISDELAFNSAIETLLDLSLLRRHSDTEALSLHRLVQVVVRDEMNAGEQRLWAERAIKALCRLFPEPEIGVWQQCQQYLPHVLFVANLIEQWQLTFVEAARLLYLAGRYLYDAGSDVAARKLCEQALTIDEQVHGENHPQTALTLHCLGNTCERSGDYAQAQQHYERALGIGELVWGQEAAEVAALLNDLGELAQTLDQLSVAESYYTRALNIREKLFGREDPLTASSLNNVAGIYEEQGQYAQAEAFYTEALQLRERLRGPSDPGTAESLSNCARFYRVVGKYVQARPLYERAIVAYEQALGTEHPGVATCCNNYAVFCLVLARYARAEQLLTRAIEIRTSLFGQRHPAVAGSWNHLARVYSKQGRYEQAQALYAQALAVNEKELGRQHPGTIAILVNMGELALLRGDAQSAEALLTEALTSTTQGQEARPLRAAPMLDLLGRVYLARAEYKHAEEVLTEGLALRQQALGKTHPDTGMSLKSLGDLALARNDSTQAQVWYREALAMLLEPLGKDHPDVLDLLEHLVGLLENIGRGDDARVLAEEVRATPSPYENDTA